MQKYCAEFSFRYNRRGMDDGERFNDWFDYCRGLITYKMLTVGKKKPKELNNPQKRIIKRRNWPEDLMPI